MSDVYSSMAEFERSGLLLRDFFAADNSDGLKKACIELNPVFSELNEQQWLEVEYEFNRLFVGPAALLAPPYASVYLDDEPQVFGKATLDVRELASALGLFLHREGNMPDDHISCELELLILLLLNVKSGPDYPPLLHRYFTLHVTKWVPYFIEKITSHAETAVIQNVARQLIQWFDELNARVFNEQ